MATPGDTPTKMNKDAKAMIHLAFEDLGGLPRLVEWANQPGNIGTFYTQIWSKIIPKDIKAEVDTSVTIEVVRYGDDDYALQQGGNQVVMHSNKVIEEAILSESLEDDDENQATE